jgi:phytol kinase
MNNFIGLLIALGYIVGVLLIAEILRRSFGYGVEFTRKFVHIGVGMLIWLVPLLFDSPWPFVLAALAFAVIDLLDWHYGLFSFMASSDHTNLGTVYFPIAAAIVTLIFWDQPPLMVAALMPLTWGDGLASVVGRSYGENSYLIFGEKRTLQGSATFMIVGGFFTWLALWTIPGSPVLTPLEAIPPSLVTIFAATLIEAISPWGLDNLTVTGISILILGLWPF